MQFTPKTEDELKAESLLEPGVYDFECTSAENAVSKSSGADMIKVKLQVYGDTHTAYVTDYLMEKMAYKLRHFCEVGGILDKYNNGLLDASDCQGVCGKVKLKKEEANGNFGPKNSVADYVVAKTGATKDTVLKAIDKAIGGAVVGVDMDIPF